MNKPTLINITGYRFGVIDDSELPKLPVGFRLEMTPETFVQAVGLDGRKWFVVIEPKKPHLELCGIATQEDVERTEGRLKIGQEFVDDREQIELPIV